MLLREKRERTEYNRDNEKRKKKKTAMATAIASSNYKTAALWLASGSSVEHQVSTLSQKLKLLKRRERRQSANINRHTYILFIHVYINPTTTHIQEQQAILATTGRKKEKKKVHLPDPSLEEQIAIAFQTNTSLEETFKSIALPIKTIDNLGT